MSSSTSRRRLLCPFRVPIRRGLQSEKCPCQIVRLPNRHIGARIITSRTTFTSQVPSTKHQAPSTKNTILRIIDISFALFHTALIVFNLTGWAFRKTRRVHLIVISLTILSWFSLGFFYGFGYCPCTDWHWDVKLAQGERGLPASWVKYYVDWLTGKDWDTNLIDAAVGAFGFGALIVSGIVNWRDWRKSSRNPAGGLEAGSPPARG